MTASPNISVLVLDAGPMIANTTLPSAKTYYTTPSVLAEIKDENARSRLQTLYALQLRTPKKESVDFVKTFAKKTGDAEVLSAADIGIIALTFELECELNGGDWRLKKEPGQARINGKPPVREAHIKESSDDSEAPIEEGMANLEVNATESNSTEPVEPVATQETNLTENMPTTQDTSNIVDANDVTIDHEIENGQDNDKVEEPKEDEAEEEEDDDDDDDDWITPSNIKKHQEKDGNIDATAQDVKTMKVACATHDFALQNVLLQVGLNLVSGDGKRISSVKTWVLRCHACFKVSRKMDMKFCPSCGGATLMRTSVSTDSKGAMKVHLKRNMQWNNRGTVYSIPKQQHGTANMKGRENLILRADQREVEKLQKRDRYKKDVDLLDPDHVPSIVSGRRDQTGSGAIKYGHGKRNPNSNRKR